MKRLLVLAVLAIVSATGSVTIATAPIPNPVIGTWQLNVSKSTFKPGPAYKSQVRTYSPSGQSLTIVIKTVYADGRETTMQTTDRPDGRDYPVTGSPDADSDSHKQVDSNTATFTLKRAGKVVQTGSRTVSRDGKTLALKRKGTTAKGENFDDVLVFDKQ